MSSSRPRTEETIAKNLRRLMDMRGWSEEATAKAAGVSQKTINNTLNKNYRPKVETVDQIANAFGLKGWHLMIPDLCQDLEAGGRLAALIEHWGEASTDGKTAIENLAGREAAFNKRADPIGAPSERRGGGELHGITDAPELQSFDTARKAAKGQK